MNINALSGPYKHVFMSYEEIIVALKEMEGDATLNTRPSIVRDSASSVRLMSFFEKHSSYLKEHPHVNPEHYLTNLRTMIKIRT